jgi:hypothetical protein
MIYFDCKIAGEVSLTIFRFVFSKKFFALIPKQHFSVVEENASVIEENASVIEGTYSVIEGTYSVIEGTSLNVENMT